jgi:hydroxysqualene dehydroxylase
VQHVEATADAGWRVDGEAFDAVLLACSAHEAARLVQPVAASWAQTAAAFEYEPIVTVYLQSHGAHLPSPMVALHAGPDAPAQFAFDVGALDASGARDGLFAFVISGARAWVEAGLDATAQATLRQAQSAFGSMTWRALRTIAERRATFMCKPGLVRPPSHIAPGLAAAGDYIDGPYPATLEGAVRSARAALHALGLRRS